MPVVTESAVCLVPAGAAPGSQVTNPNATDRPTAGGMPTCYADKTKDT